MRFFFLLSLFLYKFGLIIFSFVAFYCIAFYCLGNAALGPFCSLRDSGAKQTKTCISPEYKVHGGWGMSNWAVGSKCAQSSSSQRGTFAAHGPSPRCARIHPDPTGRSSPLLQGRPENPASDIQPGSEGSCRKGIAWMVACYDLSRWEKKKAEMLSLFTFPSGEKRSWQNAPPLHPQYLPKIRSRLEYGRDHWSTLHSKSYISLCGGAVLGSFVTINLACVPTAGYENRRP